MVGAEKAGEILALVHGYDCKSKQKEGQPSFLGMDYNHQNKESDTWTP